RSNAAIFMSWMCPIQTIYSMIGAAWASLNAFTMRLTHADPVHIPLRRGGADRDSPSALNPRNRRCRRDRPPDERPTTGEPAVAVVTGPRTSVKEQASGAWAKAWAQRGIGCLAFDHRYFGESGGKPRQLENPYAKIEDIRAAVDALRGKPEFTAKPIVAVGICAGAGYMARAVAEEPRFSAFSTIAG